MTIDIPADIEAVVYDLDGTLVRLAVDWAALEERIGEVLREENVEPAGLDAWDLLDAAEAAGVGDEIESLIAAAECDGARESVRLSLADALATGVPIGVCSLNCEAACRIALETHELATHVDSVVGRDSVAERKPAPEPLLAVVESLGATPERTLFVGDSASDEEAAARAGTRFTYVGDGPTNY
ncbi:MAG TPA: HAD-IA family hydrolase [Halococcus sp.]|nr:HAD-IA family hydrolase [Halococcus sp.]